MLRRFKLNKYLFAVEIYRVTIRTNLIPVAKEYLIQKTYWSVYICHISCLQRYEVVVFKVTQHDDRSGVGHDKTIMARHLLSAWTAQTAGLQSRALTQNSRITF